MNSNRFNKLFWKHYIILEEDFKSTQRYVELSEDNFETFSVEYTRLLQSIGSEFDVVCREVCRYYGFYNKKNIKDYSSVIIPKFINITNENVMIKDDSSINTEPLKDWVVAPTYNSPQWWKAYNKIKHDRVNSFKEAKLKNILLALASLYLVEMFFIFEISESEETELKIPSIGSSLFKIRNWKAKQQIYADGKLLYCEND